MVTACLKMSFGSPGIADTSELVSCYFLGLRTSLLVWQMIWGDIDGFLLCSETQVLLKLLAGGGGMPSLFWQIEGFNPHCMALWGLCRVPAGAIRPPLETPSKAGRSTYASRPVVKSRMPAEMKGQPATPSG